MLLRRTPVARLGTVLFESHQALARYAMAEWRAAARALSEPAGRPQRPSLAKARRHDGGRTTCLAEPHAPRPPSGAARLMMPLSAERDVAVPPAPRPPPLSVACREF